MCVIAGLKSSESADRPAEMKHEEQEEHKEDSSLPEGPDPEQEFILTEVVDLTDNTIPNGTQWHCSHLSVSLEHT